MHSLLHTEACITNSLQGLGVAIIKVYNDISSVINPRRSIDEEFRVIIKQTRRLAKKVSTKQIQKYRDTEVDSPEP